MSPIFYPVSIRKSAVTQTPNEWLAGPSRLSRKRRRSRYLYSNGARSIAGFLARALLQDAELVILDESFAALDPENLKRSLECVKKRAKSLLMIAHR
jgi:ATP-binding cassette subfamily B protein